MTSSIDSIDFEKEVECAINYTKAIANGLHQCLMLIDCRNRAILFASNNIYKICGIRSEEATAIGFEFFTRIIVEEHLPIIQDIDVSISHFIKDAGWEDVGNCVLSYDYHVRNGKLKRLVNQKVIPLTVNQKSDISLAICIISPMTGRFTGRILLTSTDKGITYEYSRSRKLWEVRQEICLTENEKEVLTLTAQGHTANEIADVMRRSLNTIKYYKRSIFDKMGVEKATEAISYAFDHNII